MRRLPILIPHRPGCADFPLPVLHGRALLAEVQMTLSVTCRRRKTSRTSALVSILNSSATFSAMRWANRLFEPRPSAAHQDNREGRHGHLSAKSAQGIALIGLAID